MKTFKAIENSTIYDVCLNTYATLNELANLMDENEHESVNVYPLAGAEYQYDDSRVNVQTNQNLTGNTSIAAGAAQLKYATK